jgi:hypothetical protein
MIVSAPEFETTKNFAELRTAASANVVWRSSRLRKALSSCRAKALVKEQKNHLQSRQISGIFTVGPLNRVVWLGIDESAILAHFLLFTAIAPLREKSLSQGVCQNAHLASVRRQL